MGIKRPKCCDGEWDGYTLNPEDYRCVGEQKKELEELKKKMRKIGIKLNE